MTKSASEKMKVKNTANKTGCATRRFAGFDIEMISNASSVRRHGHDINFAADYPPSSSCINQATAARESARQLGPPLFQRTDRQRMGHAAVDVFGQDRLCALGIAL